MACLPRRRCAWALLCVAALVVIGGRAAAQDELVAVAQPEVNQPEVTQPEVIQPEVTQPEVAQPEVTETNTKLPKTEQPKFKPKEESTVQSCSSALLPELRGGAWPASCLAGTIANGQACTGTCGSGYVGSPLVSCLNGNLTAVSSDCQPAACTGSPPASPAHGTFNCPFTRHGDVCTAVCSEGFDGVVTSACSYGTFSAISGACTASSCIASPAPIENGVWLCGRATANGTSCVAACSEGFTGSPTALCLMGAFQAVAGQPCVPVSASAAAMRGFYTLTMDGNDARLFDLDLLKLNFAAAVHHNLQLPSSYPVSSVVSFIQRVSSSDGPGRRRLMQGATKLITIGFLLLPAPELPTVSQLQARLAEAVTTVGIANDLTPAAANATSTLYIARSDATGTAQEPRKPLTLDCSVTLTPVVSTASACTDAGTFKADYLVTARNTESLSFSAQLSGAECITPGPLFGPQIDTLLPVTCTTSGTGVRAAGAHAITLTATYTGGSGCKNTAAAATAKQQAITTLALQRPPSVVLTPLPTTPICTSASASVVAEFAYTAQSSSGGLVRTPEVSVSDSRAACTITQQGLAAGSGKLTVSCTGAFTSSAAKLAITASLSASQPGGCNRTVTAAATSLASVACCKNGTAFPSAPAASSKCLACSGSAVAPYFQGPLAGAMVAGPSRCQASDAAAQTSVGAITTSCSGDGRTLTFNVSNPRYGATALSFWVGCRQPDAKRCGAWMAVPEPGPVTATRLEVVSDAARTYTSWKWALPNTRQACACSQVWWSIRQAGTWMDVGSC